MTDRQIELVQASTISPKAVSWVWDGRIPRGNLTVLAGVEGLGKTNFLIWLAGQASTGDLPGDLSGPSNVIIVSAEDDPEDTLVPRLMATDADCDHVHFIKMRKDGEDTAGLSLPADAGLLCQTAIDNEVALVIIDPINAFIDTKANSHNDHSIRSALGPLAQAAMTGKFAVLGIMHLNKSGSGDERQALMGSTGYRAAARSTLILGLDPDEPDEHGPNRVLVHGKHNLSARSSGYKFQICEAEVAPGIYAPRVELGDEVWFTAEEVLLAGQPDNSPRPAPALDNAKEFLERELLAGPRPTGEIQKLALLHNISEATLKRARAQLGVRARVEDFQGVWHLELPPAPDDQSGSSGVV